MFGISAGRTGSDVALSQALLLYTGKDGAHFATAHAVIADRQSGRPVIGAGRPLDRKALVQTLQQLAEHVAPRAEFLPATVLGVSPEAVTWWCPPSMRRVFFECENLGKRSAVVPHPGLVFQASNQGFRVFAVACSDRPVRETPLFEPPYFNTWDMGRICIGSAQVPKRVDVASIDGWEAGFFDSAFTHPNAGGKRIEYKDGEYAFWRDMLDGKFGETFPLNALVPMKRTLEQLVNGQFGRGRMNPLDTVLQQSFPSVMVPKREAVVPMTRPGERLLIASDGVYLEVLRPWVRVVRRIAQYAVSTAVPYGKVEETTALLCGQIPAALVAQFHAMARAAMPNEVGAWIVWNSVTCAFRIVALPSLSHGSGHLVYERPRLADGEWLVVDCHSHGTGPAFFSRTDNQDDQHDVKFALVLGHCDRTPSVALRLCAKGIFEKFERVPEPWAAALMMGVV